MPHDASQQEVHWAATQRRPVYTKPRLHLQLMASIMAENSRVDVGRPVKNKVREREAVFATTHDRVKSEVLQRFGDIRDGGVDPQSRRTM